jgi:hypothetical protein
MLGTLAIPLPQLQLFVVAAIIVLVVGYIIVAFWQQIAIGIAAISCLAILCMNDGNTQETIKTEQISPDKKEFMSDCLAMTDYTKIQCDNIWEDKPQVEVKGN